MRLRNTRFLMACGVAVVVCFWALVFGDTLVHGDSSDVQRFFFIAHAPGRPYVDYPVEYPPLMTALIKLLGIVASTQRLFTDLVVTLAMGAAVATIVILWRTWGRTAALFLMVTQSLLLAAFLLRLDLLVTMLAVAAVAATLQRRPRLAALLATCGTGFKLWPLAIAAVDARITSGARRVRHGLWLAGSLLTLLASWLWLGGVGGVTQVLTFRGATGWQIESVAGSFVRLVTHEAANAQQGADRFGHVPPYVSLMLLALAMAVCAWAIAHLRTRDDIGSVWVACTGALIAGTTLFSPQFVCWLIPGAAIAWAAHRRTSALAVVCVTALTAVEFDMYPDVVLGAPLAMTILVLRNVAVLAAIALALRELHVRAAPARAARPVRATSHGIAA